MYKVSDLIYYSYNFSPHNLLRREVGSGFAISTDDEWSLAEFDSRVTVELARPGRVGRKSERSAIYGRTATEITCGTGL